LACLKYIVLAAVAEPIRTVPVTTEFVAPTTAEPVTAAGVAETAVGTVPVHVEVAPVLLQPAFTS